MPSFFIQNFGCRVNQAEAFAWAEAFRAEGLRLEPDWRRSDLILVNSCTLTGRADRDVRSYLRKIARENSRARLVITGCYAERARETIERAPQVLAVVPNSEKNGLPRRVMALLRLHGCRPDDESSPASDRGYGQGPGRGVSLPLSGEDTVASEETSFRARAMLKIQDGCDSRCTFCIIPSVRGKSMSLGRDEVLVCIKNLVARGYREIVLAGIHLSSYGRDLKPEGSLTGLLSEIESVEGLGRVRLSSLDPRRIDDGFLAHVVGNPKVCQHFHLSLQHASKRILDKMGRGISPDRYESILGTLRHLSPDASLGADVIVGFPEETEEDFAVLEDFLGLSPLTYLHVFSYSPRRGTPAALKPQVPESIKKDRSSRLRRLSAEKNLRFRQSFFGKELEAVVIRSPHGLVGCDDVHRGAEDAAGGRPGPTGVRPRRPEVLTGNYLRVFVSSSPARERESVLVRITRALPNSTEGIIVPEA